MIYKEASITTLGYICEEMKEIQLPKQITDKFLTAIVGRMTYEETDVRIKKIGITALTHAVGFATQNFEVEAEKDYIIKVLCACCQDQDSTVRVSAFKCIADIGICYYAKIQSNLEEIAAVTYQSIRQDQESVAIMALEFWISLAEEEYIKSDEQKQHANYIQTAAPTLTPICLENLYKGMAGDEWNLHMASATCLNLMTTLAGGTVYPLVIQYIQANIQDQDFLRKNAALVAFGSVLEYSEKQTMHEIIKQAMPTLFGLMQDISNNKIRETAAWFMGRITELHCSVIQQDKALYETLHSQMLHSLKDTPIVAGHICWIVCNLADGLQNHVNNNPMSLVQAKQIFSALLETAYRSDAISSEHNLQIAAFTALSSLIDKCNIPGAQDNFVMELPNLIEMLKQSPSAETQVWLLQCTQSLSMRFKAEHLNEAFCDQIIYLITSIFKTRGTVVEEGMYTCAGIALTIGPSFEKYMPELSPYVIWAMSQEEMDTVCKAGMTLCGDLSRALGEKIIQYSQQFLPLLIQGLSSPKINRYTKLIVITSIGDIALAIKDHFVVYISNTFQVLESAANAALQPTEDFELEEYLLKLREAIIECYTGIVNGLSDCGQQNQMAPHIQFIVTFLIQGSHCSQEVFLKNAVGLIGDLGTIYQAQISNVLKNQEVFNIVQKLKSTTKNEETKRLALWAEQIIARL